MKSPQRGILAIKPVIPGSYCPKPLSQSGRWRDHVSQPPGCFPHHLHGSPHLHRWETRDFDLTPSFPSWLPTSPADSAPRSYAATSPHRDPPNVRKPYNLRQQTNSCPSHHMQASIFHIWRHMRALWAVLLHTTRDEAIWLFSV